MIALYNRAILLDQTGDYHGAIRDISAVIDQYPQFWTGYRHRASILRKIGDKYGAERDEFRVLKAEMEVRTGTYTPQKTTRKKEDRDINAYNKLITDEQEDNKVLYASEWRGKIQNRKVELRPLPNYLLSFYRGQGELHKYVAYSTHVDRINNRHLLDQPLCLTTQEATLDTALIVLHQQRLHQRVPSTKAIQQALDYYLVRDFDGAISVLSQNGITTSDAAPLVYFLRAQAHQAKALALQGDDTSTLLEQHLSLALQDISKVIQLDPQFAYAHYNQGNIYLQLKQYDQAIESYSHAIETNPQLPDSYYNRAIAYIQTNQKEKALADFSRAGEMGIYQAYSHIKKYSKE